MRDYFGLNSTFDDSMFRRRFRMRSQRIVTEAHIAECINDKKANTFWKNHCRCEAVWPILCPKIGRFGHPPLHRMLCYSLPADAIDEYVRIAESTALESFKVFLWSLMTFFDCHSDTALQFWKLSGENTFGSQQNRTFRSSLKLTSSEVSLEFLDLLIALIWVGISVLFGSMANSLTEKATNQLLWKQSQDTISEFGMRILEFQDPTTTSTLLIDLHWWVSFWRGGSSCSESSQCQRLFNGVYVGWRHISKLACIFEDNIAAAKTNAAELC